MGDPLKSGSPFIHSREPLPRKTEVQDVVLSPLRTVWCPTPITAQCLTTHKSQKGTSYDRIGGNEEGKIVKVGGAREPRPTGKFFLSVCKTRTVTGTEGTIYGTTRHQPCEDPT